MFKSLSIPFTISATLFFSVLLFPSHSFAQNDLLVTAPFKDSIERFDGFTGEYLGSFVTPGSGSLDTPGGVAVGPDGNVYVTSGGSESGLVLRYDGQSGAFMDVFSSGNGLTAPNEVVFHGDHMFVGDFSNGATGFVRRFDAFTGEFIDNFVDVDFADGIEFSSDSIFVSDFSGGIGRYSLNDGSFIESFVDRFEGGLNGPADLLFLDNGELLVSSYNTNSIKRYSADGTYIDDPITNLLQPEGLAIGLDGNLYAGSYSRGVINQYDINTYDFISEFAVSGPVTNMFTFRSTSVPEPTTLIPISAFALLTISRRRRKSKS